MDPQRHRSLSKCSRDRCEKTVRYRIYDGKEWMGLAA